MPGLELIAAFAAATAQPPQARIVALEARLFLEDSGELSKNVLDRKGSFTGWNTIIGEGGAPGAAKDIAIVVRVGFASPQQDGIVIDGPLAVTARTAKKLIAQRRFTGILVPYRGSVAQVLFLPDVGCAGTIRVSATLGKQTSSAILHMDCGE